MSRILARTERRLALREAGLIQFIEVNEDNAAEVLSVVKDRRKRPDLLIVSRDWTERPNVCRPLNLLIDAARQQRILLHIIAALDEFPGCSDELLEEAFNRLRQDCDARPTPFRSMVEIGFGEILKGKGLAPIPQYRVAQYFLDYAVIGSKGAMPVRLDIEVDGRHWHEAMPGQRTTRDEHRNSILRRLGWRPVRFWADEILEDEERCANRVMKELSQL